MKPTAYHSLSERFARLHALQGASAILHWDSATMMPPGGAEARSDQLSALSVLQHELITAPELGDWLEAAQADSSLDELQRANVQEMMRLWRHAVAVPPELVEALTRAGSECEFAWRTAKPANDFKAYAPLQARVLELVREMAQAKAAAFGVKPYDALMDAYDPGRTTADIDPVFAELEAFLPGFLGEALEAQRSRPALSMDGEYSITQQKKLFKDVIHRIGFDFNHGRLDESAHPFCGGVSGDIRITTRYTTREFTSALMGVIHETGHAMYDHGLPAAWRTQPIGQANSMALHESQSLFLEMQISRSREFLEFLHPLLVNTFNGQGEAWTLDNLCRLYHKVEPGFIRVDADEVTYPLHVILRYRLEQALINGDLQMADLPGAWDEGMHRSLGLRPGTYAEGCMQDIHWTDGSFGYFPSYTLGAMMAAQFRAAMLEDNPGLPEQLARGEFVPMFAWLRENIHQHGCRYSSVGIMPVATGKPLEVAVYKTHLRERYLAAH